MHYGWSVSEELKKGTASEQGWWGTHYVTDPPSIILLSVYETLELRPQMSMGSGLTNESTDFPGVTAWFKKVSLTRPMAQPI